MSVEHHRAASPTSVRVFVVTISDTRTPETDTGGRAMVTLLEQAGHVIAGRTLVRDDPEAIDRAFGEALSRPDVQVVISTGGTGIASRDRTYDVVTELLDRRLNGFGELFRMLSYQEIGAAAMLSRALAGTSRGKIVAALPGSEAAVRLAMTKLLLPELGHLVREVNR